MEIKTTKNDVIWSYLAQVVNMSAGLLTLPVVLKILSPDEIGMNYILISITSIVSLFDLGFSSQFARNITYIISGAQTLEKEGISNTFSDTINELLLSTVYNSAKRIYRYLAFIALLLLLSIGTIYIGYITDWYVTIPNILYIWILFCITCFFNIYFLYYNAFLLGRGMVAVSKMAQVYSRVASVVLTIVLLLLGCGLYSIVISNLLTPFIFRIYAHIKFYDDWTEKILKTNIPSSASIKNVIGILFYNAKKLSIISILATAIGYASTLVVGGYLTLADVGSYGVLVQIVNVVATVSCTFMYSIMPSLSNLLAQNRVKEMTNRFGFAMFFFYVIQVIGLFVIPLLPLVFNIFHFNVNLPILPIIICYYLYKFFDQNQSLYSQALLAGNDLIFFKSAVFSGLSSFILMIALLSCGCGLWGVIMSQVIPLAAYPGWKWPTYTKRKYSIAFATDLIITPCRRCFIYINDKIGKIWSILYLLFFVCSVI